MAGGPVKNSLDVISSMISLLMICSVSEDHIVNVDRNIKISWNYLTLLIWHCKDQDIRTSMDLS